MSKPSKLKRAIKEMEVEIEEHNYKIDTMLRVRDNLRSMIERLKKIDSEKNEKTKL